MCFATMARAFYVHYRFNELPLHKKTKIRIGDYMSCMRTLHFQMKSHEIRYLNFTKQLNTRPCQMK